MKNKKLVIAAIVVAAIVILGVAYAAISNISLNINGTAAASPSQSNFIVGFTGTPTVTGGATAKLTDDKNATMTVTGLTAKGDKATATYTVKNSSPDLTANLTVTNTNSNTDYFKVTQTVTPASLAKGASATVTVTVELLKTPITGDQSATIQVKLVAAPAQPAA